MRRKNAGVSPITATTASSTTRPTAKDTAAAAIGLPMPRPRAAFMGACTETSAPAKATSIIAKRVD